jgi:hypothetical protein
MNRHGNIIAECEIVEQGHKVEKYNLDEVWRDGYTARSKPWDGDLEGSASE